MMKDRRPIRAPDAFMIVMSTFGLFMVALVTAPLWCAVIWGL